MASDVISTVMERRGSSLGLRFLIGAGLVLATSLGIFYLVMRPPMSDLGLMALFLAATAAASVAAGYIAYRAGWLERAPSIRWTLTGSYVLAGVLTFLNVWLTARLMFASPHDLELATVLLIFASGMAAALGMFFATAITRRVQALERAARAISAGDLATRAPLAGADEIARLGRSFNEMAARLEEMDRKRAELDRLRRDLIAWVSHDLQTPLASIRAMVEALADGVVTDAETTGRYLDTIRRETGALSTLIDDLFQVAQIDAGGLTLEPAENSLADLISDTLEAFSAQAARQGVRLEGGLAPDVDPVWMDARRMERVLRNLVVNALRHTPPGGQVTVQARRQAGATLVEVTDTGEGIPAEDLPFVFERFYRGEKSRSRATGGAGLGLAIAGGIVAAHHGEISVESRIGVGTRFIIQFPSERPI
jgi:signal transduction histidine kinase